MCQAAPMIIFLIWLMGWIVSFVVSVPWCLKQSEDQFEAAMFLALSFCVMSFWFFTLPIVGIAVAGKKLGYYK